MTEAFAQQLKTHFEPTGVQPDAGETLAQAAYRALRIDIIRGVRSPQERLRIEKLKTIYNVGPTPLREALQMLASDQLVLAEGNRGFTVAPLDLREFEDLNVARIAIETAALRLSVARGGDDWEAAVVAASYLMKKEDAALLDARDGVTDAWEKANGAFHTAMVAACGSQWLLRMRNGLQDQCERYRRASIYRKLGERDLNAEHQAISAAVLARDADLACVLVERHFALTASSLLDAASGIWHGALITLDVWLFLCAGVAGGIVNAAAGGAKLFVFPLLLAAGLPPLTANATGTVALWPAQLPAAWVLRRNLIEDPRTIILQLLPSLVGAFCGALALIFSSEAAFLAIVPALLLISVAAIVLGNRTASFMRRLFPGNQLKYAAQALLFATGFYGGYFGAGLGFMLIAVLSVAGGFDLHRANAAKILFAFCINTTAIVPLSLSGLIDWTAAAAVLIGGLAGGYLGARLAQTAPEWLLRSGIGGLGLVLTASFLLR